MPDGSSPQHGFNFPRKLPTSQLRPGEIVVDLFAGGGGASEALRQALGRDPDIAINHDATALGLHAANHPFTRHMSEDVWQADPVRVTAGRAIGWLHASPDCTHFSQAKGGQPRDRATRSLAWVIPKWSGSLRRHGNAPRIISMENVMQMLKWGPLIAKRDKATGRVVKLDGTIAAKGERVPLQQQFLIPDKRREGQTWRQFIRVMQAQGYIADHRKLKACDYGAGTSRERLFGLFRCDGQPIVWPAPTHGKAPGLQPLVTAADCIDFAVPCPSIFTRKRPLAAATLRRIAKGVKRYVIDAAEPFIVQCANASASGVAPTSHPLGVITAWPKGGSHAVAAPTLVQTGYGEAPGQSPRTLDIGAPLGTVVGGGVKHAVVAAFLEQANGGYAADGAGHAATDPMSTITGAGSQQRLVTADLAALSPEHTAGALRVAAFLVNYYGNGTALDLREPLDTITTRDRLALVTVTIKGTPYVIVDIGLRMLRRDELFRAQGFPPGYIIDRTASGHPLTISASVRMVGNSVSPPPLAALARANLDPATVPGRIAA